MSTEYAPLLKAPAHNEPAIDVVISPAQLVLFAKRVRGVTFFVRILGELQAGTNDEGQRMVYDYGGNVSITVNQLLKLCADWASFSDAKEKQGKSPAKVKVSRLGDCIFVG